MEQAELGRDDRYKERAFSTVLGTSNRKQWKVFQLWGGKKESVPKGKKNVQENLFPPLNFV